MGSVLCVQLDMVHRHVPAHHHATTVRLVGVSRLCDPKCARLRRVRLCTQTSDKPTTCAQARFGDAMVLVYRRCIPHVLHSVCGGDVRLTGPGSPAAANGRVLRAAAGGSRDGRGGRIESLANTILADPGDARFRPIARGLCAVGRRFLRSNRLGRANLTFGTCLVDASLRDRLRLVPLSGPYVPSRAE